MNHPRLPLGLIDEARDAADDAQRSWLPLSAAQRMVWLDLRLQADPVTYQLTLRCRLNGALDLPTARQALQLVAARHDALRLRVDNEQARQWLCDSAELPLLVHVLDSDEPAAVDARVAQVLAGVLPLGDTPLAQVDLLALPDNAAGRAQCELLWRVSHLVIDYAGLRTLAVQWVAVYNALLDEVPGELPRGTSFVATLAEEQAYAASPAAQADLNYWRQRFDAGVPEPLFPRRASDATAEGAPRLRWTLSGNDYAQWRAACTQAGVTDQRALVGLLALAIATRFDLHEMTLALALHGRDARTLELVGMMASVMLVRCQWSGEDSIRQAVRGMAEQLDEDYRHTRTPVAEISRVLGAGARGLGRLFDVSLSFVQAEESVPDLRLGGASVVLMPADSPAIVPLPVLVTHRPLAQALDFEMTCDPQFIGAAELQSLAQVLQRTVAQFGKRSALPVAELEPASSDEQHTLLQQCNPQPADYPLTQTLHELVQAQCRATPDALAVVDGELRLSYAELNAQSDALARRIRHALRDVLQPEPVVAVALPRSAATVVTLLAILKAQAVYLPLDIAYPEQRLQYLLDDGQAVLLIDEAGGVTAGLKALRLIGDAQADLPADLHAQRAQRLAYVIYTSGSTGQPKPVGVSHRAAVNLAYARRDGHDPLGAGDRVLAAISVGFDVSIGQLILPLLSGAAIVIAPPLRTLQAEAFWALLAEHQVTHINSVPSFFETVSEALIAMPEAQRYTGLKRLMLGGEALTGALARKLQQRLPGTTIVNMYGPTEACIDATAYVVPNEGELPAALPIGKPLANYRAYVLDSLNRLCPIGVIGELCLAGEGVARGYLRRPDATAEKFTADPFASEPGQRLYRTGDLARWTADGNIEFLGRNDQQVKIRGQRVETGEIEATLLQHAGIQQAAVIARKDATGQARLVAYLVNGADSIDIATLKPWLAQRLPEHMVPSAFVMLDALPLTTNGKLDRKALPEPDEHADARREYAEPQGAAETTLAALWAELLKLQQPSRVGRHDHFFDLGGHSLLAITLVDRLRRAGLQLDVRAVFERPALQEMAAAISTAADTAQQAIPLADRSAPLPLSFAQERLWLLAQIDPQASRAYHIPGGVRLCGQLDVAVLRAALLRIVQRHEALRTTFVAAAGGARQRIGDAPAQFDLPIVDLASHAEPETELQRLAADECRAPFDLQAGPLLRARLLKLGADEHVLLVTLHHIVADGWSMGVLISELSALYAAGVAQQPEPLQPLPIQYADYAVWQRQQLQGAELQAQVNFWRQHLAGAPALLELPTDRPRPAQQSYAGATIAFTLDAALTRDLNALAQRQQCTPYMVLLAAWAALLARISGQGEVVVGTPVAQRTRAEVEPLIGFFVNTLALRVNASAATTVADLLAQVRATMLASQPHQDLPFAQLVDALKPPRSSAHSPVFQVMLSWLNTPPPALELPGLRIEALPPLADETPNAKFELSLELEPAGNAISGRLNYATTLFDRATVQRHLQHLKNLLRAMAADESQAAAQLPLLGDAEREQLLYQFNPAPVPFVAITLDALVRSQAFATPESPAVFDGELTLSYAELDARSEMLAQRIRHALRDVAAAEPVVGVALPRSAETVIALLAILKAGAVYLPLDIAYPAQRLQYMLDDAGAALLVAGDDENTRELRAPRLPDLPPLPFAGEGWGERAGATHDDQRLAYVIYTSGSTGQPKAVGVSHRAAVNLSHARQAHDPVGPGSRVLAAISVGFDVSIGQLLLPLLRGAAIVIAPPLSRLDAAGFWALLARYQVTQINSVPSFFDTVSEVLVAMPESQRYSGLKRLMLGGEPLTGALARKLQQRLPGTQIVNMYGPTEACIDATAYVVPNEGELQTALPIGKPLPNYRAYIVDSLGRLCPIGVVGELCLAGEGLARGYLGRPEATAEKFVHDPFTTEPGQRMYRTGDIARWTAEGQIEFLGRNDEQVKIRGQRVETGEIEATLLKHPALQQAAVLALKDAQGQARLVAYVVAAPVAEQPETDALKSWLAEQLPEHMVPAALMWLPALPLTTNGKLDRKALPTPDAAALTRRRYVAPEGETEAAMAAAWQALLGVPQAGRDDDFFDLGGHSLRAISLVESLRQVGLRLDVPTLFAQPTLRAMAAACVPLDAASDAPAAPLNGIPNDAQAITPEMLGMIALTQTQIDGITALVPGGAAAVQDIYPLAPLQQGMLFHHLSQTQGDVYLTPMISAFAKLEQMEAFVAALQLVIARHDVLRSSFAWEGLAEPVQVVWRDASLALQTLPASADADALAALKAHVDPSHYRIDLRQAPLLRALAVHDEAQGRWLFALCMHHLLLDHSSLDIVVQEVLAIQAGAAAALPPSVPFRELVWQARTGVTQEAHEAYFRAMLADVDEPTAPYGVAEVAGDASGVHEAVLALPQSLNDALRVQARAAGASAASLMHLAWALVLARTSETQGRADVVFGTVLFGRLNAGAGAERALGMLINTLPLRVRTAALPVRAALQATHRELTALMRHEHAALALAQRCSGVAAPAPLFTALFNFRHAAPQAAADTKAALGMDVLWAQERTGYPLSLAVDDSGSGLQLTVQAAQPIDATRVGGLMLRAVEQVVQALQSAEDTPCDALDLIDAEERMSLLSRFNPAPAPYPLQRTLHELVQAQCRATPDALAVVDGELRLNYAELDAQSDALARRIRHALRDVLQPEPVVAVALPRSAATVIALLAILKAQAVYLPLDIAYPEQRLQYLLDDGQAALLIDEAGGVTAGLNAPRLIGDAQADLPADLHAQRAQRLAYVIYTSGSTGQPKPVGVSHRAAVNLAYARRDGHDPLGAGDRVLAAISVGFDVSIGQLILPLLSGAAIVIAPPLRTLQAEAFWALLAEHQVTHINSVPSFFETVSEALIAMPEAQRYTGLKRLMLGGEALTGALARKLQQRLPGTTIVNMYGPTEACIDATAYVVPDEGELPAALPIGKPLANYRAYVLDSLNRLCPIGVIGELCLAGEGVARGYLRRPDATAEKFTADPFASEPGARLYRTGDLARWTADGNIEFFGRNDQQVKIRGQRVETGEIEATLLQHAGIQQAAVIARKDATGQARLVAYLVNGTDSIDIATLKPWLAQRLPEHMVPSAFVMLDALPLTTNGKLDRKALPEPDALQSGATPYAPPRDPLEAGLQAVWQAVLDRKPIGVHDDFFALGGHSLLALKLVSACQNALREVGYAELAAGISLRQLLARPTIAAMCDSARRGGAADLPASLVCLRSVGTDANARPLFCVHPQSGSVWCFTDLARALPASLPVWGLQASGLNDGEEPLESVPAMAAAHLQAMRAVQPQGPYRILGYSSGGVEAFEIAAQLRAAGESVELLALLDSPYPDGCDMREATAEEVLADAAHLLGVQDPAQAPRDAAGLLELMRQRGLAAPGQDEVDTQRLIATARGIVQATRRHVAAPISGVQALQLRALKRDTPPADWSGLLPAGGLQTVDLDCDHVELIGPRFAAEVARHLAAMLC